MSVVPNRAGTGFVAQTTDEGTVQSVDTTGGTITLVEGTKTVTYQTPTVTIPANATVKLNGKASTLSKLAVGDRVSIAASEEETTVVATDSSVATTKKAA